MKNPEDNKKKETSKRKKIDSRIFVQIGNFLIDAACILAVEAVDIFENNQFRSGHYNYYVLINKSEDKKLFYANTQIPYKDVDQRNKAIEKIKKILIEDYGIQIKKI